MDYTNFHATAYIGEQEVSIYGTLKECSQWADKMLAEHAKDLKEIKFENLDFKKEN